MMVFSRTYWARASVFSVKGMQSLTEHLVVGAKNMA
jgi:hypothetical protein